MLPVYAAKAGGFFFIVFGVIAMMGGLLAVNPVWKFGPYDPTKVTAGSQPDWYMGWPDGALRIMPNLDTYIFHHTISWNVLLVIVLPMLTFTFLLLLPFVESWVTGDKREHHLLQRPRDVPTRTATMVALMTFYGLFWAAGGNDIIAVRLHLSINQITYFLACRCVHRSSDRLHRHPALVHLAAALGQREASARLRVRDHCAVRQGGYSERHLPPPDRAYVMTARDRDPDVLTEPDHRCARQRRRAAGRHHSPTGRRAAHDASVDVRRQRPEADGGGTHESAQEHRTRCPATAGRTATSPPPHSHTRGATAHRRAALHRRGMMVADANAVMGDADHNAALHTLHRTFGDVRPTTEVSCLLRNGVTQAVLPTARRASRYQAPKAPRVGHGGPARRGVRISRP